MLPWALYNLTPRDQAGPQLRPWSDSQSLSFAGAASQTAYITRVPDDHVLLVTWIQASMRDTAVQPSSIAWDLRERLPSTTFHNIWSYYPLGNLASFLSFGNEATGNPLIVLQPEHDLQVTFTFSGVAGGATCRANVVGVLIPKGTIALS